MSLSKTKETLLNKKKDKEALEDKRKDAFEAYKDKIKNLDPKQAKKEFDTEQSKIQVPVQPLASATVGQRLTGTSAKGVKMKRSKAATSTRSRGTKQLGREQQTQSLNI